VLAGAGIISADSGTTIVGDVGSSPTPTVTGLLASQVTGTLYTAANNLVVNAQYELTSSYISLTGHFCTQTILSGEIGSLATPPIPSLGPGVYCFSSSAQLKGNLTLVGTGSSSDFFIFLVGSALTTDTGASVTLTGGASTCSAYWQVGSSATIQTGNDFAGNIVALTSITLDGGILRGRALARNGTVTISGQETIVSTCTGPSVALSPISSQIVCGAGSSITKTALVLSDGLPLANTLVTFTIIGPDSAQSGTAITDASGLATFTIANPQQSGTANNADEIFASINGGRIVSGPSFNGCVGVIGPGTSFCSTALSPAGTLMNVTPGPPKQVIFSVLAKGGLFSIVADTPPTINASVFIPTQFDLGTTQALGVIATKIDPSAPSVVELTIIDLCGKVASFDPVSATITIPSVESIHGEGFDFKHREVARFDGIARTEGTVLLQNSTPGVGLLVIRVNGLAFRTHLLGGQTKKLDISSALFHGTNKVTVAAFGSPGSSVDLTIYDGK
jgi:Ice-binding-like